MYIGLHVQYRYSCQILNKLKFFRKIIGKNTQIPNLMKIRSVGTKLFHADRQDEADNRFSQFCEHP
jgi:hypothetical protein